MNKTRLNKKFYNRELLTVAIELLGNILVKKDGNKILAGRIVEVEAYNGDTDSAAHTFTGKTKRNEVMFNEGGLLYVYFTYGAHHCCNVVTGIEGKGTAVLIRAVEPSEGIDTMIQNRFKRELLNAKEIFNLTSGPGKVCSAFSIIKNHSGIDLTGNKIYLVKSKLKKHEKIGVSKRIGITRSVDLPWRFFIEDNPYLSRK
ncbi:MAG: DNA-3-methyladenine glycosylase [Bacteroidetes bacterium]|nr:DNA-3-methyladenine glycosylase [Bacteroidota bacterium]MCH8035190.1 DNA-3-methyladenine glycosylase [Bacteroidota bacterium]